MHSKISVYYMTAISGGIKYMYITRLIVSEQYIILFTNSVVTDCFSVTLVHMESFSNSIAGPACTACQVKTAAGSIMVNELIHPLEFFVPVVFVVASCSNNGFGGSVATIPSTHAITPYVTTTTHTAN